MFSLASFNHGTQTRWQPTCFCSGSTSNPIFFLCLALCMSWKNPFARPIHLWENPFAGHILLVEEPFCRALVAKPFCKAYLACMVNSFSLSAQHTLLCCFGLLACRKQKFHQLLFCLCCPAGLAQGDSCNELLAFTRARHMLQVPLVLPTTLLQGQQLLLWEPLQQAFWRLPLQKAFSLGCSQ